MENGLVRTIGIGNFSGQLITDLFRCARTIPAILQIEYYPYLTQNGLVDLCTETWHVCHGFTLLALRHSLSST